MAWRQNATVIFDDKFDRRNGIVGLYDGQERIVISVYMYI